MSFTKTSDTQPLFRFADSASRQRYTQEPEYTFRQVFVDPPQPDEDSQYLLAMAACSPSFNFLQDED